MRNVHNPVLGITLQGQRHDSGKPRHVLLHSTLEQFDIPMSLHFALSRCCMKLPVTQVRYVWCVMSGSRGSKYSFTDQCVRLDENDQSLIRSCLASQAEEVWMNLYKVARVCPSFGCAWACIIGGFQHSFPVPLNCRVLGRVLRASSCFPPAL